MTRSLTMMALLAVGPEALACGGFFCSPTPGVPGPPVVQQAERIAFAIDDGMVDVHVQVFYEGDPIDFAWVVPVPALPELMLGSDALFEVLAAQTQPVFSVRFEEVGRCTPRRGVQLGCAEFTFAADSGGMRDTADVVVVDESTVGPFETVTLQADTADALLGWLQANGYDLPDDLDPVLAPYVAGGSHFVALRLSNDADTGDIEPIVMRYAGDTGVIPIQLTAIAAAEDMPLEVYVFGEHRAVPANYMHVVPNPAAIDWLSGGANYRDVVSRAANAAGGKAFATDFAGSPGFLRDQVRLAGERNALEAGAPLTEEQVAALERAEALLDYPMVTRMTSALSPAEMTVDPTFAFNPDLPEVPLEQTALVTWDCKGKRQYSSAYRILELPDGQRMLMPSDDVLGVAPRDSGDTGFGYQAGDSAGYLAAYDMPAIRIEQLGTGGPPQVLVDNAEAAAATLDDHNREVKQLIREGPGPACSAGARPGAGLAGAFALLLVVLRRRAASVITGR